MDSRIPDAVTIERGIVMPILRTRPILLPLLLPVLVAGACGPPPVPAGSSSPTTPVSTTQVPSAQAPRAPGTPPPITEAQEAAGLPAGHPPLGGEATPMGGAPITGEGPSSFSGTVRLVGELAERSDGYVFMSVKPAGMNLPSFSRRYSLTESAAADGARLLSFELGPEHAMGGLVPGASHVVEAWFDPDGNVDSKEGGVRASVPLPQVEGDTAAGIEIVLDPAG